MNPYKEDGPRARLSFDPAYCKRCTGPPSVNDGYITGPGWPKPTPYLRSGPPARPLAPACGNAPPHRRAAAAACPPPPSRTPEAGVPRRNAIAAIETLVRQRSNGAFIMRV